MNAADLRLTSEGILQFAVALFHQMKSGSDDLFFSPYSIGTALGIVEAGSTGKTRADLRGVLGFSDEDQVPALLGGLGDELLHRTKPTEQQLESIRFAEENPDYFSGGGGAPSHGSVSVKLSIANALWTQLNYQCRKSYLHVLTEEYQAAQGEVDFNGAPAQACETINSWVREKTFGKIDNILSPEMIDPLTRLVVANAIYFKARWESTFFEGATSIRPFHRLNGETIDVNMMRQTMDVRYFGDNSVQVVELPYIRPELAMTVVFPATYENFEPNLSPDLVGSLLFNRLEERRVDLSLPRFRIESSLGLRDGLSNVGLSCLFGEKANLSGISEEPGFRIDEVLHSTFVEVDEEGTEAAAVTTEVSPGCAPGKPPQPVSMVVDRPFLFFIVDRPTQLVLFGGKATRLSESERGPEGSREEEASGHEVRPGGWISKFLPGRRRR